MTYMSIKCKLRQGEDCSATSMDHSNDQEGGGCTARLRRRPLRNRRPNPAPTFWSQVLFLLGRLSLYFPITSFIPFHIYFYLPFSIYWSFSIWLFLKVLFFLYVWKKFRFLIFSSYKVKILGFGLLMYLWG